MSVEDRWGLCEGVVGYSRVGVVGDEYECEGRRLVSVRWKDVGLFAKSRTCW